MRSIGKIILMVCILFFTSILLKMIGQDDNEIKEVKNTIENLKSSSVVFIGSSRIRRGINPFFLKREIPEYDFINLGMGGSTFLANYLIADYLITNSDAQVLCIELSPIIIDYTLFNADLFESLGINVKNKLLAVKTSKFDDFKIIMDSYNSILMNKISLKREVKSLIPFSISKPQSKFGYTFLEKNNVSDISTLLTMDEIEILQPDNDYDLELYQNIISRLALISEKKGKRIIFLLPVAFRKEMEREIVITIYQKLPETSKISFDRELITAISHKEYLLDKIHFNKKGSEVFSKEISRLIKKQNLIPPLNQ